MTPPIWGEGLHSRWYWGGRVALRRNTFIYEIRFRFGNANFTFLYYRKQPTKP